MGKLQKQELFVLDMRAARNSLKDLNSLYYKLETADSFGGIDSDLKAGYIADAIIYSQKLTSAFILC
ncbi:hypothetical protein Barb6_02489 [Bacteroidales bacterium Barb6]|nr:hypothetical protein Barb6_02489 [Bacteroidales bacterium Barb6]